MQDQKTTPRKRRRVTVFRVITALLLAACCSFSVFRLNLRSKLNARIETIRAAGYPVTCAELDKWYSIPPDIENAAHTIEDAFSFYKTWDRKKSRSLPLVGTAELPPRTESLSAEMKTLITEYIVDNNDALELLHAGAMIENCRYTADVSAGFNASAPNLGKIHRSARLLALDAVFHADNGDGASATRSAISCFGIARSLAGHPWTPFQGVRASCQDDAVSTIERVANQTELTDEQLVELVERVRESDRMSDISCALVGHRCAGLSFLRAPESVNPDYLGGGVPIRPVLALYEAAGLADADAVIYLDLMDGYLKAVQLPLHRRQEAADAVDARLKATSRAHRLLHAIMPVFSRTITAEVRMIAHLRVADAGLAVERYRLAADRLPDKLADLVPKYLESVPRDPFDGNELRYKKLEPGFVVYSIGEDLSDDGGKERQRRKERGKKLPNWDVTFIVER